MQPDTTEVSPGRFSTALCGERRYWLFVPSTYRPKQPAALLVMLHGCTQTPADFATGTRMHLLAERYGLLVAYPEQTTRDNVKQCWNWFRPEHQQRGQGEPAEIAAIVARIRAEHAVDPRRIFVAGISAGGAMAVILGVTYPDLFAAVCVCCGVVYGAARSLIAGVSVQRGRGVDVESAARAAFEAMGSHRRLVPLLVFQGSDDRLVVPRAADQLVAQWLRLSQLVADQQGADPLDGSSRIQVWRDGGARLVSAQAYLGHDGEPLIVKYLVNGMGHAWPGGSAAGSFTDPAGPDASRLLVEFCLARPMPAAEPLLLPALITPGAASSELVPAEPGPLAEPEPAPQPRFTRLGRTLRNIIRRLRGRYSS
jgi:poly(hydroxyalkanoate) depolymerase family esterase